MSTIEISMPKLTVKTPITPEFVEAQKCHQAIVEELDRQDIRRIADDFCQQTMDDLSRHE